MAILLWIVYIIGAYIAAGVVVTILFVLITPLDPEFFGNEGDPVFLICSVLLWWLMIWAYCSYTFDHKKERTSIKGK